MVLISTTRVLVNSEEKQKKPLPFRVISPFSMEHENVMVVFFIDFFPSVFIKVLVALKLKSEYFL